MPFQFVNCKSSIVNRKKKNAPDKPLTINYKQSFSANKRAFTLIELLIVIALLGILAAAVLIAINPTKRNQQARDAIRKSDLGTFQVALETATFEIPNFGYPKCGHNPLSPDLAGWPNCRFGLEEYPPLAPNHIKSIPGDPLNNSWYYFYSPPPNGCNNTTNGTCTAYLLIACLENGADTDPRKTTHTSCTADSRFSNKAIYARSPGNP